MKIAALFLIVMASFALTAHSAMDSQNTKTVKPAATTHTHPENCSYFAVTHTHGEELGGANAMDHDHGKTCKR